MLADEKSKNEEDNDVKILPGRFDSVAVELVLTNNERNYAEITNVIDETGSSTIKKMFLIQI